MLVYRFCMLLFISVVMFEVCIKYIDFKQYILNKTFLINW